MKIFINKMLDNSYRCVIDDSGTLALPGAACVFVPTLVIPEYETVVDSDTPPNPLDPLQVRYKTVVRNPWAYWTNEIKLASIRLQRDYLLQQNDWRAIRAYETGNPESQAWLDYRQELRDFPNVVNVNLPIEQIVWPTPPNS